VADESTIPGGEEFQGVFWGLHYGGKRAQQQKHPGEELGNYGRGTFRGQKTPSREQKKGFDAGEENH